MGTLIAFRNGVSKMGFREYFGPDFNPEALQLLKKGYSNHSSKIVLGLREDFGQNVHPQTAQKGEP